MTDTNENSPSEPQTPAEATLLIRAGSTRTGFHETAEAIFPTSGYVYDSAAEAVSYTHLTLPTTPYV